MIDRLQTGDSVEFTIIGNGDPVTVTGEVRQRAEGYPYIRIKVDHPRDYSDVTLVGGGARSHRFAAHQDYTWERLGTVLLLNVSGPGYQTVIHAK